MAAHPAAHSSLHSQSPGFVLRQQDQVWWASPVVKPLLAPQPLLRHCFRGGSVAQIWLLKCEGKFTGRGTSRECIFCLTPFLSSQFECCNVRRDVWSCGSHPITMKPKAKNAKPIPPRMIKRKRVSADISKHLTKLRPLPLKKNQQILSVKGKIVNNLGLDKINRKKSMMLCKYLFNKRENKFPHIFD